MIQVVRRSPFSGKVNTMTIPLTQEAYEFALARWNAGTLIQVAFPALTADQREFIKTGITPAEWDATFADEGCDCGGGDCAMCSGFAG